MNIRHLSFAYGKKPILYDISLQFKPKRITTILGANGCGKSTLFNLCTRNLRPARGLIELDGTNIFHFKQKDFARKVAIVHQQNRITGDITVRQLVSYGRTPYVRLMKRHSDEDDAAVAWAIEQCNLDAVAEQPVVSLSGGQRQRVWIAMALAQQSEMIFLDEPTTYLDVRYQIDLLQLVRDLNERLGITIVMILHDINQAISSSHDIIGLQDGKVAFQGTPQEVVTSESISALYGAALSVVTVNNKKFVLS